MLLPDARQCTDLLICNNAHDTQPVTRLFNGREIRESGLKDRQSIRGSQRSWDAMVRS